MAGGFDSFTNVHRAQYFHAEADGIPFLEKAIRFGTKYQESKNSAQMSLFGGESEVDVPEPAVPKCETWGNLEQLRREKEVVGIYISGHPLDDFKHELHNFCNISLSQLQDLNSFINRELTVAGMVADLQHRTSKNGKGFGFLTLEDYDGSYEFKLFGDDYLNYQKYMISGAFLYVKFKVVEGFLNRETNQRGEPRIQFMQVMQLQDVMESLAKKLTLHVNIKDITPKFITDYRDLLQKHKGNQPIYFVVHHQTENIHLNMENGNLKVAITKSFLDDLDNLLAQYNLNDRRIEKIVAKKAEDTQDDEEMAMEDLGLSD